LLPIQLCVKKEKGETLCLSVKPPDILYSSNIQLPDVFFVFFKQEGTETRTWQPGRGGLLDCL